MTYTDFTKKELEEKIKKLNYELDYLKNREEPKYYKPLKVETLEIAGIQPSFDAMRLPTGSKSDGMGKADRNLALRLSKAGTSHAKFMRGMIVWAKMEMQVGFMIELETHRIGVETLSTSSSMLQELKAVKDEELAEQKQGDLPSKVYTRIATFSYQALKNIYSLRRNHRHPDWQIFCRWIEGLPMFHLLIKEDN